MTAEAGGQGLASGSHGVELPLAAASKRLRRSPGRPRTVRLDGGSGGRGVQGAPPEAAPVAAPDGHFATTLPPRGLPLALAAQYSGIPVRRLWTYIAEGRLRPIRPPGMRRVLLDRVDVDALLEGSKERL